MELFMSQKHSPVGRGRHEVPVAKVPPPPTDNMQNQAVILRQSHHLTPLFMKLGMLANVFNSHSPGLWWSEFSRHHHAVEAVEMRDWAGRWWYQYGLARMFTLPIEM